MTALPDGNYTNSVYGEDNILVSTGNPVALFYGYKTNGVFASDAEARTACLQGYLVMKNAAGQDVRFGAGDVRFVDLNGDGVINEADELAHNAEWHPTLILIFQNRIFHLL